MYDMQTQSNVGDIQRSKLEADAASSMQEKTDERFKSNKHWLELQRLRPMVEQLRQKNIDMEMELVDVRAQLQLANVDSKVAWSDVVQIQAVQAFIHPTIDPCWHAQDGDKPCLFERQRAAATTGY